jgi:hypothetical protein
LGRREKEKKRWKRMEKFTCTARMRHEEVLQNVKEDWHVLHTEKMKVNWIGHMLCRNCLLRHVTEAKIEGNM